MTDTYMYVCSQQSGGAVNCHYYCVLGHVADNSKTTPPNVYVSGDGGYSWRLVTILLLLAKFLMSVGKCTCSFEGNTYYEVFCAVVKYMYV